MSYDILPRTIKPVLCAYAGCRDKVYPGSLTCAAHAIAHEVERRRLNEENTRKRDRLRAERIKAREGK